MIPLWIKQVSISAQSVIVILINIPEWVATAIVSSHLDLCSGHSMQQITRWDTHMGGAVISPFLNGGTFTHT